MILKKSTTKYVSFEIFFVSIEMFRFELSLIGQKSSDKSIFRNNVDSSKRRCHNHDEFALS